MQHIWNKNKNQCKRCGIIKLSFKTYKKRFDGSRLPIFKIKYFRNGKETTETKCFEPSQLNLVL